MPTNDRGGSQIGFSGTKGIKSLEKWKNNFKMDIYRILFVKNIGKNHKKKIFFRQNG